MRFHRFLLLTIFLLVAASCSSDPPKDLSQNTPTNEDDWRVPVDTVPSAGNQDTNTTSTSNPDPSHNSASNPYLIEDDKQWWAGKENYAMGLGGDLVTPNARINAVCWGADSRHVWFSVSSAIGRFDTWTQKVSRVRMETLDNLVADPKGKWVAGVNRYAAKLWVLNTEDMTFQEYPIPDKCFKIAVDPQGKQLALGCASGEVVLINTDDFSTQTKLSYKFEAVAPGLDFSPSGKLLVACSKRNIVTWRVGETEPASVLTVGVRETLCVSVQFLNEEEIVYSDHYTAYSITKCDWKTGKDSRKLKASGNDFDVFPGGERIATYDGSHVTIWEIPTATQLGSFHVYGGFGRIAVSPDGRSISAGGEAFGHVLRWWSVAECISNPKKYATLGDEIASVRIPANSFMDWSSDGKFIATASNQINLWQADSLEPVAETSIPKEVRQLMFAPDGSLVSENQRWKLSGSDLVQEDYPDPLPGFLIKFLGPEEVVGFINERVYVHDLSPEILDRPNGIQKLGPPALTLNNRIVAIQMTFDNQALIRTSRKELELWNLNTTEPIKSIKMSSGTFTLSPDEKTLLIGSRAIVVHQMPEMEEVTTIPLKFTSKSIGILAFSHDGQRLAVVIGERIRILRTSDWKTIGILRGHTLPIRALRFSPDDQRIATAGNDGTLKLWDLTKLE